MTEQEDISRHERHIEKLFSKINKLMPVKTFTISIVVLMAMWTSMFGLVYIDQQNHKEIANKQYIEVVKELGNIKILIEKK